MMSPAQCRAARAWLRMPAKVLGHKVGLSKTAINNYETGHRCMRSDNLFAIEQEFNKQGIKFFKYAGQEGMMRYEEKESRR